jgi:proline iminopeptidase
MMVQTLSVRHLALATLLVIAASCSSDQGAPGPAGSTTESGSVMSDGFELQFIVEGTGSPALVVGSAPYYSRAFSEDLREHLRLVFMDHRGFAPSPGVRDTSDFALDVIIDDMELVRQSLELGPVVVIGHSGHAYMALEYAKTYPEHVSHVVMIGISPDLSEASAEAAEQYWNEFASSERKAMMEENLGRLPDEDIARLPVSPGQQFIRTYVRNGPRAWYDPSFDSSPLWEGVDINMDMFNHVWGPIFRDIDITRGLDTFDRPVFLALGRYDFLLAPPSAWDPIIPFFRDITVRVFEQSGHTPQYEEASAFDRELMQWIHR